MSVSYCKLEIFIPKSHLEALRAALAEAGLPENVRGETLGIPQFAVLAAALSRRL